jgi:uncharacterized protein (TIGR00251 family)
LAFTRRIPGLKSETWGTLRLFTLNWLGDRVLIPISDHPLGATFAIRVQPRAARTAITGTVGDSLKVSLSAPPLDGRANAAVVEFFSEILSVPRSAVQVVAGERSRNKIVRIAGCSGAEVQRRLREHFTV